MLPQSAVRPFGPVADGELPTGGTVRAEVSRRSATNSGKRRIAASRDGTFDDAAPDAARQRPATPAAPAVAATPSAIRAAIEVSRGFRQYGVEIGCCRLWLRWQTGHLFQDQRLQPLRQSFFTLPPPSIFPVYRVKKIGH